MGDNSTNDSFCSKERIILVSKSTSKLVLALNSLQSKSPELYHLRWIQLLAVYVFFLYLGVFSSIFRLLYQLSLAVSFTQISHVICCLSILVIKLGLSRIHIPCLYMLTLDRVIDVLNAPVRILLTTIEDLVKLVSLPPLADYGIASGE